MNILIVKNLYMQNWLLQFSFNEEVVLAWSPCPKLLKDLRHDSSLLPSVVNICYIDKNKSSYQPDGLYRIQTVENKQEKLTRSYLATAMLNLQGRKRQKWRAPLKRAHNTNTSYYILIPKSYWIINYFDIFILIKKHQLFDHITNWVFHSLLYKQQVLYVEMQFVK